MSSSKPHLDAEDGQPTAQLKAVNDELEFTPRQLKIVWGKDKRYWQIPEVKGSKDPATLIQVCWLEVTGFTADLDEGKYAISFKVEMETSAFGWSSCPLYMMAKAGKKGKYIWKKVTLPNPGEPKDLPIDGQLEIEITSSTEKPAPIYFGLYEVWTGRWKGGLKIHNAKVKKIK